LLRCFAITGWAIWDVDRVVPKRVNFIGSSGITRGFFIGWFEGTGKKAKEFIGWNPGWAKPGQGGAT
jgi:hypothetical protein